MVKLAQKNKITYGVLSVLQEVILFEAGPKLPTLVSWRLRERVLASQRIFERRRGTIFYFLVVSME